MRSSPRPVMLSSQTSNEVLIGYYRFSAAQHPIGCFATLFVSVPHRIRCLKAGNHSWQSKPAEMTSSDVVFALKRLYAQPGSALRFLFSPRCTVARIRPESQRSRPGHDLLAEPQKNYVIAASAMSFLPSTWWKSSGGVDSHSEDKPAPSSALNFLVAFSSCNLEVKSSHGLALPELQSRVAGIGGYSRVKIGYSKELKLIAIKSALKPENVASNCDTSYDQHLNQLSLELRILTHEKLRKHPNILDAVALCMDEASGVLNTSLVLEYSEIGTLRAFLVDNRSFSPTELAEFILQVAHGLEMVHALHICHGDVKTTNTLVFPVGNKWLIKISDFGQSVVATHGHEATDVPRPVGTPLLSAPEIRDTRGRGIENGSFTIKDAIRTDTFSFGLLAWEVLKHGDSFFDPRWMNVANEAFDVYEGEDYLRSLCEDGLLGYGQAFLKGVGLGEQELHRFSDLFHGVLRDNPCGRKDMTESIKILESDSVELIALRVEGNVESADADDVQFAEEDEFITMWSTEKSLYEVCMLRQNVIRSN